MYEKEGRKFYMKSWRSVRALLSMIPAILISLLFIFATSPTLADNGPHGNYTALTDACAGCHRAHSANAANLLIEDSLALCLTCHGNAGTGADTNVVDGLYLNRDTISESPAEGVVNRGLKGGGFTNALMDTDVLTSTTAVLAPTTSSHLADGSTGTTWGHGPTTTVTYAGLTNFSLSCVSCHNPHGGGNYRILRSIPIGSGVITSVAVTDESAKFYTVSDSGNVYMAEPYSSPLGSWCSQCHTRYLAESGSGHVHSGDAIFEYRHTTTSVDCTKCHVAHGTTATMGTFSGAVEWPDDSTTPSGDTRSSLLRLDNRGVCVGCHVKADGSVSGGACGACHGAPPLTGAHDTHSSAAAAGYGLTGSSATTTDYQYGCGECHPLDPNQHQNGSVDVDLSPVLASLKALNDPGAAYAGGGGTCSGVYCHSGPQVSTSQAIGSPTGGTPTNPTYTPPWQSVVVRTRIYQTTPAWDGGQITTCDACHEFPLTTSSATVSAGAGDSHQWIGDWGYGNLHAWNHGFAPIPCRTCHYGEITQANTWSRTGWDVTTYNPVSLASRVVHANGGADVAFDTVNDANYSATYQYELDGVVYNPADKSCTNVGCHHNQTYVQWGSPSRWWNSTECNVCHQF